jgi:hypothetical protein
MSDEYEKEDEDFMVVTEEEIERAQKMSEEKYALDLGSRVAHIINEIEAEGETVSVEWKKEMAARFLKECGYTIKEAAKVTRLSEEIVSQVARVMTIQFLIKCEYPFKDEKLMNKLPDEIISKMAKEMAARFLRACGYSNQEAATVTGLPDATVAELAKDTESNYEKKTEEIREGIREGKIQGKMEIAKRMKNQRFSLKQIYDVTGLLPEMIKNL